MNPRRAVAKLNKSKNGALSFEEWGVKTIDKFAADNADGNAFLTPAEYAATAPKPPKRDQCAC